MVRIGSEVWVKAVVMSTMHRTVVALPDSGSMQVVTDKVYTCEGDGGMMVHQSSR